MPTFRLRQHPPCDGDATLRHQATRLGGEVSVGPLTERRPPRCVDAHLCARRPRSHAADATRQHQRPSSTNKVVPGSRPSRSVAHCGRDRDSRRLAVIGRRSAAGEPVGPASGWAIGSDVAQALRLEWASRCGTCMRRHGTAALSTCAASRLRRCRRVASRSTTCSRAGEKWASTTGPPASPRCRRGASTSTTCSRAGE